ncbi:transcriptional regulator [Bacteroides sp. AN502(2024)]|uniref:winged helix-turn-helix domain-containing protein n=1 Tax=Bacteroides sp. AN502(2024) TaxID=3160599 RepID=UPI0035192846
MRTYNVILLFIVACIGGIVLFFTCKYAYESKLSILKQKAKSTFIRAVNQEVEGRNVAGPLVIAFPDIANMKVAELPDSVSIVDSIGMYKVKLDKEKHYNNITTDTNARLFHSIAFKEHPIQLDSLNLIWKKYLNEAGVSMETALYVSVLDRYGNVTSASTSYSGWRKCSNLVSIVSIGYACEIEVMAYLHYSVWNIIYMEIILGLLIYIVCMYVIYKIGLFIKYKIISIRDKEVIKHPVVKIVKEMKGSSSIRSYKLHEDFIFHADQNLIEFKGQQQILQPQSSKLLELFLRMEETGYVLKNSDISKTLWSDGSVSNDRIYKAVARLRSNIKELDSSIEIKKCVDGYQLVL